MLVFILHAWCKVYSLNSVFPKFHTCEPISQRVKFKILFIMLLKIRS